MSTRSSTRNLFPPLENPKLTFRRRTRVDPNLLNDFNMATNRNGDDGPPPNGGGDLPVPDLRTMEELCQPTLNGASHGQNLLPAYQAPRYQAPVHQASIPQPQVVTTTEFTNYTKANDAILKNMQTNMTSLKNSNLELKNMFGQFMKINTASSSGSGTLPSNTITNPKEDLKVECETEVTKDMVPPTNKGRTKDVQPSIVQIETQIPNSEPVVAPVIEPVEAPVSASKPNPKSSILYPSRLHDQKLRDKVNDQKNKIFQIFQDFNFNISFADALILMPKFGPTIKSLLTNKKKLFELARTLLNEHCSAVLLKKLPEKLGDPEKFLIPCDFPGMDECLALADLGATINLMSLSTGCALIDYISLYGFFLRRTMDMIIDQQVALDEALVPHASRLRIRKSNFRLRSYITSKESTLQLATATVHHHSKRFKMNNKKRIVNLEYFREMLHICPRLPNQTFDELSFEEEILSFLRYLGHNGEIKKITDVNINKLHQLWRSFTAVINKFLSGKSTGYDSLRLSQAQILWGMYHKKNVDFAYLLWFIKFIIHFFMTKDPSIPKRNKFGAILPIELTNEDIKNSAAYKEYYVVTLGSAPPKTKVSVRKTQSSSDTTIIHPTVAGTRLSTSAKGKQPAKSSKAKGLSVLSKVAMTEAEQIKLATKKSLQQTHISQASGSGADEGTGILPGVPDVPTDESDKEIFWKSSDEDDDDEVDDRSDDQKDEDDQDDDDQKDDDQDDNDDDQDTDNDGDDFVHPRLSIHEEEAKDEESFDIIVQTPENSDDESNDDASLVMNVGGEKGQDAEDEDEELYRDIIWKVETPDIGIDSLSESTPRVDVQASTTVSPLTLTAPTLPPPTIPTISQFAGAVSSILEIVKRYMDQWMNEAVKVAVQIQSDRLRDEAQAENEEFLNKLDDNIQKIIKEQVREQVKVQVSKILLKIEKTVSEQLEAKVLTRSPNSSKTSYAVAANRSELELKKILIEKMESNKSIHRSDQQRNLYKALVDAYECEKIILDTYGDSVTFKRRRDDADKDEEPSVGSDRRSKRKREGKEP
uniref:Reverse transcriptase domain-containing protein n=1 Tax=Tanacetum cinerariifolium TaxID=118510 RepID=A0A699I3D6_TANCI|nr:reverse transcriptase domain-containing protein [Tanacetum cinerariifolium]